MSISIPFVSSSEDLVTTQDARRDGFLEIALRRNRESIPYLDQGKALWAKLNAETKSCDDILGMNEIRVALLLAAGLSVKAQYHLTDGDKIKILEEFVGQVLRPCGEKYVDEVVYRYLLSLGDQLGGRMRNIIGAIAREKLSRRIIAQLRLRDLSFAIHYGKGKWVDCSNCATIEEIEVKAIRWQNGNYQRMLVYNTNVPGVSQSKSKSNNVDIVVFNKFTNAVDKKHLEEILGDQKNYVVMGELKGGIDPAGADEHWKTARTALDRIRATFKKVYIAFVGGAIEKAMADEIYNQLQSSTLDYAANLTNDNQLSSFCDWLINQ